MKDEGQFNQNLYYTCSNCNSENEINAEFYGGMDVADYCLNCGSVQVLLMEGDERERSKLQDDVLSLMKGIQNIFFEMQSPMTARGVFYQATTRGLIDKTEDGYNKICRILGQMRWRGWLSWDLITDESRFSLGIRTFRGKEDALDYCAKIYRRELWQNKPVRVQVFVEKLALAGILQAVTDNYDIKLYPMRGFSSLSYTRQVAEDIIRSDKHSILYHLGDYDPSGVCAANTFENTLRSMGAKNFTFERLAVHEWQIEAWKLPTRPTKQTDKRAKNFSGESCELDAIRPNMLQAMVQNAILQHISREEIEMIKGIEEEERRILKSLTLKAS